MAITRRKFVAQTSGLLLAGQPFFSFKTVNGHGQKKILVLLHLAGGNDWFNTIIPCQNPQYYKARPSLAISSNIALPINNDSALHPCLSELKALYDENNLSIILNVGDNQPTLSHQKSIEKWQRLYNDKLNNQMNATWLARYAKLSAQTRPFLPAINVEPFSSSKNPVTISRLTPANAFAFDVDTHYRLYNSNKQIPLKHNLLSQGFNHIAELIENNNDATIYNISLGGFDTHSNQLERHAFLLKMVSQAIFSFQHHLKLSGLADDVMIVVYSEFGRSLKENQTYGTEHGHANHILIIGEKTRGGILGKNNLEIDQQPQQFQFDFRQVYATLFEQWLRLDSKVILGQQIQPIAFI